MGAGGGIKINNIKVSGGADGKTPTFKIENGKLYNTYGSGANAVWYELGNVVGEKGDKGDKGEQGIQGENGNYVVIANPENEATANLEKINIDGIVYNVVGSGGGDVEVVTSTQVLQIESKFPTDYGNFLVHLVLMVRPQQNVKLSTFKDLFDFNIEIIDFFGTIDMPNGESTNITGVELKSTFLYALTDYSINNYFLRVPIGTYLHYLNFQGRFIGQNNTSNVDIALSVNFEETITSYNQIFDYEPLWGENDLSYISFPGKHFIGVSFFLSFGENMAGERVVCLVTNSLGQDTNAYLYNPNNEDLIFTETSIVKQDTLLTNITDTGVVIDKTLSIENAAADAKVTGDRLKALEADKVSKITTPSTGYVRVYAQDFNGNDIAKNIDDGMAGVWRLAQYMSNGTGNDKPSNGRIVQREPELPYHVANKKYVDEAVANAGGKKYLHAINFIYNDNEYFVTINFLNDSNTPIENPNENDNVWSNEFEHGLVISAHYTGPDGLTGCFYSDVGSFVSVILPSSAGTLILKNVYLGDCQAYYDYVTEF